VPGSPERELYISGTVLTPNGSTPPDNWPAMFGAGAWERASNLDGSPGQWYLHLFAPEQPDWNWKNQVCARSHWFTSRGMIMDLSCSKYSGSRRHESKKRRPTVLPAHSVVHLARHHGLELLKVLRISTPTPRGQEAQLD
jgi:Alpha amylase, catalytic domain